jgi:hypothetical protein
MENKTKTCLCRNSIKLTLLEYLNIQDEPVVIFKLIDIIKLKVKESNQSLTIDDNFLSTYIQGVIEDLIETKSM